ncbi:MAG: DUF2182 domain-containing protein [Alphaproteobacteria bacterium]
MNLASGAPLASLSSVHRLTVLGIVGLVTLGAWVYLTVMIDAMSDMASMPMTMPAAPFSPGELAGLFVMWTVMQAAMMLPTALPMTFAFARMAAPDGAVARPVAAFTAGYVLTWTAFSIGATVLHAALIEAGWLGAMSMKVGPAPIAGAILVVAGVYQWLPLKQACLKHCRTPLAFLMTEWRDGTRGALTMGWRHGLFCVGCCWALMALLFVAGTMDPFWIVAIAAYVLIEKVVRRGEAVTRAVGLGLMASGAWMLLA